MHPTRATAAAALALLLGSAAARAQATAPGSDGRITIVVLPFASRIAAPTARRDPPVHRPGLPPLGRPMRTACPAFASRCASLAPDGARDGGDLPGNAAGAGESVMPVLPARTTDDETGVGAVAAELLIEQLLASGRFRVLDPAQLEALQLDGARIDAGRGGRRRAPARRPAPGEVYLLRGSVTRLGTDERSIGGGGGGGGLLGVLGVRVRQTQVGLAARLVDAATGEVVASVSAVGRSKKGTGALLGGLGAGGGGAIVADARDSASALGQAMERAVRELGRELGVAAERRSGGGAGGGSGESGARGEDGS